MSDSSNREREIFSAALECATPAERAACLDRACGDDAGLRTRVEVLLRAHDEAGGFLGAPPGDPGDRSSAASASEEGSGTRIGRYKILERIGEGGFGVVYMAEQEEPVRRRVALKIIKLGMDTRAVVARFEAERQALAMMEHPNIARVLDGGATETGRPFFVMELVRGVPITKFCDERRLTMRERIGLFLQVCHAVQHAHQKGIIHRDLKPSNILVTLHDDRPVPKVIDFGIAKATELRLTEKTLFTRFHQFVGTPAYMSPEQAGLSGLDVDTRSDIYSLGVLLYELLTDRTPFDAKTMLAAGYEAIHRMIREEDPPAPSRRLASLSREEQTSTAERRGLPPSRLSHHLRGDLDRIVMKCLQKDRARRYETASGLAMDLRRHLDNRPILARPDTTGYRLAKFLRRHARSVTVAATVVLLLGCVVVFYTARLAGERDRARREAEKAAQVSALLTDLLTGSDPYRTPGAEPPTVRSLLDAGAARVQRDLAGQPAVQAEMLTVIGRVYMRMGLHDQARPLLEQALALGRGLVADPDGVARTLNDLGVLLRDNGDLAGAEPFLREALDIRRRRLGEHNDVAISLVELGRLHSDQGKRDRAEPLYQEALDMRRRVLGNDHRETAVSLGDLGLLLWEEGDLDAAEPLLRQSLEAHRKALGNEHPNVAAAIGNLALVIEDKGDLARAEPLLRDALAMYRRTLGDKHYSVANALNNLAYALHEHRMYDEAARALGEASEIVHATLGDDHPLAASVMVNLGRIHLDTNRAAAAEPLLRRALEIRRRAFPDGDWRIGTVRSLLGAALTALGRYEEAEAMLLDAEKSLKPGPGREGTEATATRERLAALYEAWGRPEQAAAYRTISQVRP